MSSSVECECRIPGTNNSSLSASSALVYLKGELAGNITLNVAQAPDDVPRI